MDFIPRCLATTIGSLPLDDAMQATRLMLSSTPEIPSWVQMAKRFRESMTIQFTEGLPGLKWSDKKIYFDTKAPEFHNEIVKFYEDYLAAIEEGSLPHLEKFSLTPQYAEGFNTLIEMLTYSKARPLALKGQVTGPFTLTTSLTDEEGKSAFYDPQLRDIVVKMICLKTKWQIKKLHLFEVPVIISIDEPSLVGFGSSAYMSISAGEVQKDLNEVVALIHNEGGYACVHCCENTDWSILLSSDIDILSFDAYSFFDKLMLYADTLRTFTDRKGILAWGLIPTSHPENIKKETPSSLVKKWHQQIEQLAQHHMDVDTIIAHSLITPSCGAGSLEYEDALKVLQLLKDVSQELRKLYVN